MIEGNYLGLSEEVLLFSVTVNLIIQWTRSLADIKHPQRQVNVKNEEPLLYL